MIINPELALIENGMVYFGLFALAVVIVVGFVLSFATNGLPEWLA